MEKLRTLWEFIKFVFNPPPPEEPKAEPLPPEPLTYTPATEETIAEEYVRAARSALRRGETEEAQTLCEKALALDASNLFAYHLLGQALLEQGDFEGALAVYERARAQGDPLQLVEGWIEQAERRRMEAETASAPEVEEGDEGSEHKSGTET